MSQPSRVCGEGSRLRKYALEWVVFFCFLGGKCGGRESVLLCGDEGGRGRDGYVVGMALFIMSAPLKIVNQFEF